MEMRVYPLIHTIVTINPPPLVAMPCHTAGPNILIKISAVCEGGDHKKCGVPIGVCMRHNLLEHGGDWHLCLEYMWGKEGPQCADSCLRADWACIGDYCVQVTDFQWWICLAGWWVYSARFWMGGSFQLPMLSSLLLWSMLAAIPQRIKDHSIEIEAVHTNDCSSWDVVD